MKIIDRFVAWIAWWTALRQLASGVPYSAATLEEIVADVAAYLELSRIYVANELTRQVAAGYDLRTGIIGLVLQTDPSMLEPVRHRWNAWSPAGDEWTRSWSK